MKLKKSVYYFLPNLVSGCASFVTLPILTRYLSPKDFGVLALAQGFASLVIGVLDCGVSTTYERNFFEHTERVEKSGLFFSCALYILATCIAGALFAAIFPLVFTHYFDREMISSWLLSLVVLIAGLRSVNQNYYTYYRNSEMPKWFASFGVTEFVLNVALSIFAVAVLKLGILGLVLGQFGGYCFLTLIQSFGLIRRIGFHVSKPLLVKTLKIGYPLTVRIGLNIVSNQFDKFILGAIGSTYFVGIYNIAERIGNLFFMFITALGQLFIPELYRKILVEKGKSPEHLGEFLAPYFFVCTGVALGINLFTEEFFHLFVDPKFFRATTISELIVISMLFLFFQKTGSAQLMAAKHTGRSASFAIVNVSLVLGLGWPLTHFYGYLGTAVATVFVRFFNTLLIMALAQKSHPISYQLKKSLIPLGVLTLMTGLVMQYAEPSIIRPSWIAIKIGFLGVFLIFAKIAGFELRHFKEQPAA